MSTTYHANAIIGIKIPAEKLFVKKTVKAFVHNFSEDINFHPQDGRRCWKESVEPIEGFDTGEPSLFGLPVLRGPYVWRGNDEVIETYYVGLYSTKDSEDYRNNPEDSEAKFVALEPSLTEIKNKIKAILEPKGLWNESKFGLWAVKTWS